MKRYLSLFILAACFLSPLASTSLGQTTGAPLENPLTSIVSPIPGQTTVTCFLAGGPCDSLGGMFIITPGSSVTPGAILVLTWPPTPVPYNCYAVEPFGSQAPVFTVSNVTTTGLTISATANVAGTNIILAAFKCTSP